MPAVRRGWGWGQDHRGRLHITAIDARFTSVFIQIEEDWVSVGNVQRLLLVHGLQPLFPGTLLPHTVQNAVLKGAGFTVLRQLNFTWYTEGKWDSIPDRILQICSEKLQSTCCYSSFYTESLCFLLFLAFSSTGWYFTDLLPPILFRRAKNVCDSLLAAPVGVSWTSDSSNTLSSSRVENIKYQYSFYEAE